MKSFIILLVIIAFVESAKLPRYITKCSRSDPDLNDCILKSTIESWSQIKDGVKSAHIPKLDPFYIEKVHIDVGGNLVMNLYESNLLGLTDISFKSIKLDNEKHAIDVVFSVPKVSIIGKYDMNGKILLLPIQGKGDCNVTLMDGLYKYHAGYTLVQKGQREHVQYQKSSFSHTVTRAYFKFSNLFNGNEVLGDQMNKFLEENWEDVDKELGAKFGEAVQEIITSILTGFANQVAYEDWFLD